MKKNSLLKVTGHRVEQIFEEPEDKLVPFNKSGEILKSVLRYFNDSRFPNAPITSLVQTEALTAESGAASSEHSVRISFRAERHEEWYSQLGLLAKILAENILGTFPRKVSMAIRYEDNFKCLLVAIEVGVVEIRIDRTGKEDFEKVR